MVGGFGVRLVWAGLVCAGSAGGFVVLWGRSVIVPNRSPSVMIVCVLAKIACICCGVALVAMSQSLGVRPSRLSRTQPPMTKAWKLCVCRVSMMARTFAGIAIGGVAVRIEAFIIYNSNVEFKEIYYTMKVL